AVAHLQDGGDIGAGAEEGGVTERVLPAITAEDVPALTGQRDHQRDDKEIEREGFHARAPNRPLGRTKSTAMKIKKMPTWPSESPRNRLDRLSTTPIARPPISAPGTEPMPPSTTMVKATSTKALPALGLT